MKKKQITISVYQIFIALLVIIAIIGTVSIVKKHVPKQIELRLERPVILMVVERVMIHIK